MKIKRIIEIEKKDFEQICEVANDTKSRLGIVPLASSIIVQSKPYEEPRDNFDLGYVKGLEDAKPKQGEWIIVKDEKYGDNVKCPFCGKELAGTDLNFCCKCGADMRKGGAK